MPFFASSAANLKAIVAILLFCTLASAAPLDGIRLNHIQAVGTHNSYHIQPKPALLNLFRTFSPAAAEALQYTHAPLPEALAAGIRNFEIDVFYDPLGGLYANRTILRLLNENVVSGLPELSQPGFKVLHIQDIDFNSSCLTFKQCLSELKAWSDANLRHLPLTVKLELKSTPLTESVGAAAKTLLPNAAVPLPVTFDSLVALEAEIISVFPRTRLITPDDVRGNGSSLIGTLETKGWPLLTEVAGKVIFLLIPTEAVNVYLGRDPNLVGRLIWPLGSNASLAAIDLDSTDLSSMRGLLQQNRLVWARADVDTKQARENNSTRFDTLLAAGVNIIQTDYPAHERPNPFNTSYAIALPADKKARCNPVSAPVNCSDDALIEPLPGLVLGLAPAQALSPTVALAPAKVVTSKGLVTVGQPLYLLVLYLVYMCV